MTQVLKNKNLKLIFKNKNFKEEAGSLYTILFNQFCFFRVKYSETPFYSKK